MSRRHAPADCDLLHDSEEDVTDTHRPTAAQAAAITLLDGHPPAALYRASVAKWAQIERVAAAINDTDTRESA